VRTQEEILERMRAAEGEDILGFERGVLLQYLDFEHAREFLKDEATAEAWEKDRPRTDEDARKEAAAYAGFAWGKVEDHRGISAGRNIAKMSAWCWLLGLDDVVARAEAAGYAQYGAPQLKILCDGLGLPVPADEWATRMMSGLPCRDGCDEGCGS
jgi:hypothetical protein